MVVLRSCIRFSKSCAAGGTRSPAAFARVTAAEKAAIACAGVSGRRRLGRGVADGGGTGRCTAAGRTVGRGADGRGAAAGSVLRAGTPAVMCGACGLPASRTGTATAAASAAVAAAAAAIQRLGRVRVRPGGRSSGAVARAGGCRSQPGNPVRVMLAQRLADAKEIVARLGGRCAAEYK